ncbi:MAG: hypothetical protein ACYTGP_11660 [Planctomycetota bacterium]
MIGAHLRTILWLRWRLAQRRLRRAGPLGPVITVILAVAAVLAGLLAFLVAAGVGKEILEEKTPDHVLLIWDGVVVAFLFFWVIGIVGELQRTEALSLDKLLHLPISLRIAFLLNYLSSLVCMALIVFVPLMLGLTLAMVIVYGIGAISVLALLVSFVIMVTAVTYQFRGWLAALMMNKRRRGTIVAVATLSIIVVAQLPQLLNLAFIRSGRDANEQHHAAIMELERRRHAGEITAEEASAEMKARNEAFVAASKQRREKSFERTVDSAALVNLVVPLGWLPYGARAAANGKMLPVVLGSLGALLIGVISLGRSYRTTVRIYTGGFQSRRRRSAKKKERAPARARGTAFLERSLPWCSEHAAAVALSGFRSFVRAPHAKMLLMTPVILLGIFGFMLFAGRDSEVPRAVAPLVGLGVAAMTVFFLAQFIQNIFGFDRDGFRVFVLSPVARRDILLGKNLSIAPFAVAIGGLGLVALQFVIPQNPTHLVASALQLACIYLIFSMVGNVISILAPVAMAPGTLKPVRPKWTTVLKQMAFAMLFPIALSPTVIPLGLELLLDRIEVGAGIPVYLLLTCGELAFIVWLYGRVLGAEGRLLQAREQRILVEVTAKAE